MLGVDLGVNLDRYKYDGVISASGANSMKRIFYLDTAHTHTHTHTHKAHRRRVKRVFNVVW